jgi:hypothetical protein
MTLWQNQFPIELDTDFRLHFFSNFSSFIFLFSYSIGIVITLNIGRKVAFLLRSLNGLKHVRFIRISKSERVEQSGVTCCISWYQKIVQKPDVWRGAVNIRNNIQIFYGSPSFPRF